MFAWLDIMRPNLPLSRLVYYAIKPARHVMDPNLTIVLDVTKVHSEPFQLICVNAWMVITKMIQWHVNYAIKTA